MRAHESASIPRPECRHHPHNPRRSLISSRLTMRAESLGARERATVLFPENDVPHSRTSLVPDAMSASNSLADTGATRNQNAGATVLGGVVGARLLCNRAGALWWVASRGGELRAPASRARRTARASMVGSFSGSWWRARPPMDYYRGGVEPGSEAGVVGERADVEVRLLAHSPQALGPTQGHPAGA